MVEHAPGWLSLLFGVASLGLLGRGWLGLRGTTLVPAWCWAVLGIAVLTTVEAANGLRVLADDADPETLRFAAAVLAFSPTMALLGAKRPQSGAWQFVVVTLWAILALPVSEIWLRGRGEALTIAPVRSWFLLVLILVGMVNHLPTRFAAAAAQLAGAQTLLLWPHMPFGGWSDLRPPVWLALALLGTAIWTARRAGTRRPREARAEMDVVELRAWSVVWREFRDWFGAVWSVRVMDRMNASAAMYGWPVALSWDGFVWRHPSPSPLSPGDETPVVMTSEQAAAIQQSLRTLLRRFVSPEWMERRLKPRQVQ